jgi:hypothetical protein
MRSDGSIPISALRPLRNSSLIFTSCALSAGLLSTGVDNAAHLGGVATGFILGLVLSRPITGMRLRTGAFFGRFGLAALVGILLLGAGVSTAKYSSKRLTGEWLYAATLHWFMPGEVSALQRYRELAALALAGKWDGKAYANRIEREVIPFWSEADARLAKLDLPITSDSYESCQWWRSVIDDRLHAYQLTVQALRQNDNKIALQAGEELQRVDDQVHERAKARAAQR